jgi:UDPglucose 6-dehydrogenase
MASGGARMNVCVFGLWHLGTVTAACLASGGHNVVGLDYDEAVIEDLKVGQPPLFEPGLEDLVKSGVVSGKLSFTADARAAVAKADVIWVTYDTPVDEYDQADVGFVFDRITGLFPYLEPGTLVLISSQLPVGTTRRLEDTYIAEHSASFVSFGYSPENLRLGKAIEVFTHPDRVVVGIRSTVSSFSKDKERVIDLLKPFGSRIEWMSIESAEMTKHALNAFLATSVVFINEVASLCEQVGADAKEVERGLKSEVRIGPKAYLSPGGAFAGGTLARDIAFLEKLGEERGQPTHLLSSVRTSNVEHRNWARRKLKSRVSELRGRKVAVLGLTYKPGTSTLRRSDSVELCEWLAAEGAIVQAHDPSVQALPAELSQKIVLCSTAMDALEGASAAVIGTNWPEYKNLSVQDIETVMEVPVVIDASRFLENTLTGARHIQYVTVGRSLL